MPVLVLFSSPVALICIVCSLTSVSTSALDLLFQGILYVSDHIERRLFARDQPGGCGDVGQFGGDVEDGIVTELVKLLFQGVQGHVVQIFEFEVLGRMDLSPEKGSSFFHYCNAFHFLVFRRHDEYGDDEHGCHKNGREQGQDDERLFPDAGHIFTANDQSCLAHGRISFGWFL